MTLLFQQVVDLLRSPTAEKSTSTVGKDVTCVMNWELRLNFQRSVDNMYVETKQIQITCKPPKRKLRNVHIYSPSTLIGKLVQMLFDYTDNESANLVAANLSI